MDAEENFSEKEQVIIQQWVDRAYEIYSNGHTDDLEVLFENMLHLDSVRPEMYAEFEQQLERKVFDNSPTLSKLRNELRMRAGRQGRN